MMYEKPPSYMELSANKKKSTQTSISPRVEKKIIFVEYNDQLRVEVAIPKSSEQQLDCAWLFHQGLKLLMEKAHSKNMALDLSNIVALKTKANIVSLDYWLTLPHKPVTPLEHGTVLVPFFSTPKVSEAASAGVGDMDSSGLTLKDFDILMRIGKGGYSRVLLARKKQSGRFYALKQISKKDSQSAEKVRSAVLRERKNLLNLRTEAQMVQLRYCFQTERSYYFVMDLMAGGDLFHHICKRRFTEDEAKFYTMEIILGLEALHSSQYILRDLKPENLLVDIDGHINFADFGFLKRVPHKTTMNYSYRGTPVYMAPEVISKTGYNYLADYYSMGCVVYELLTGKPPFGGPTKKELFQNVLSKEPEIPSGWSIEAQDFVSGLLEKRADDRLGASSGFNELVNHPWLRDLNINHFRSRSIKPPLVINPHTLYFRPKRVDADICQDQGSCRVLAASDNNCNNINLSASSPMKVPSKFDFQLPLQSPSIQQSSLQQLATLEKIPRIASEDKIPLSSFTLFNNNEGKKIMSYLQVPSQQDSMSNLRVAVTSNSSRSRTQSPDDSSADRWGSGSDKNLNLSKTLSNGASNSPSSTNETDFETELNEIRGFEKALHAKVVHYNLRSSIKLSRINRRSPYYYKSEEERR